MRLGQLARKISVRQTDIVDFLAKINVEITNESNARLEDEHVHLLLKHFAPSLVNEKVEEESLSVEEPVLPAPIFEDEPAQSEFQMEERIAPSMNDLTEEKVEVIKAPKVDLPGLKVLGKIDLPEPKKKELPVSEEVTLEKSSDTPASEPESKAQRIRNTPGNRVNTRRERPNKSSINPIALQRERDARAAAAKREEDAIREKQNRTEHYLKRVKMNAPTKAARIYKEEVEEFVAPKIEEPKSLIGKFFRWLTKAQ